MKWILFLAAAFLFAAGAVASLSGGWLDTVNHLHALNDIAFAFLALGWLWPFFKHGQ